MSEIYFDEKYGKLYDGEEQKCVKYVYNSEVGRISNIFMMRRIPIEVDGETYYDIITPYGYGGPYTEGCSDVEKLTAEYNAAFSKYCEENNIVSEFVRFHLFEGCDIREYLDMDVVYLSDNVVVDTTISPDDMWMKFEHKVRKNVKKARNNELVVLRDDKGEYLDEFLDIYYDTMKRNNALESYYFPRSYFEQINETLKGQYVYFHTVKDGRIVSTELVLCGDKYAYSFLGGTLSEYYDFRPNDLLKYDIISWCYETGREKFILGGGYHKDDGIYRYKKCYAPNGDTKYFVGKKIHNKEVYDKLVDIRAKSQTFDKESSFFPLYRS